MLASKGRYDVSEDQAVSSTSPRARLISSVTAAFLATSAMTGASLSLVQQAYAYSQNQKEMAFWNAGYSYCDAEKLGQYWQMSTYDAKLNAGLKILEGYQSILNEAIDIAIQSYGCPNGFNFDDSKSVAALWSTPGRL